MLARILIISRWNIGALHTSFIQQPVPVQQNKCTAYSKRHTDQSKTGNRTQSDQRTAKASSKRTRNSKQYGDDYADGIIARHDPFGKRTSSQSDYNPRNQTQTE